MRNYQEKTYLGAIAEPGVGMDMGRAQSRGACVDKDRIQVKPGYVIGVVAGS